MLRNVLLSLTMIVISGCRSLETPKVDFKDILKPLRVNIITVKKEVKVTYPDVTLSLNACDLNNFSRRISDITDYSIIFNSTLAQKKITAEFKSCGLDDLIDKVARSFSVNHLIDPVKKIIYIGSFEITDRSSLFVKVINLSSSSIDSLLRAHLSNQGRLFVSTEGYISCTDKPEIINSINEVIAKIKAVKNDCWVLQFFSVHTQEKVNIELGFNGALKSDVAISIGTGTNEKDILLSIIGEYDQLAEQGRLVNIQDCLLLCKTGQKMTMNRGLKIPIPLKTVSDQGTVSTSKYDYVDVGFKLDFVINEISEGMAQFDCSISQSSVVDNVGVDEIPVIQRESFNTSPIVRSGDTYLISSMKYKQYDDRYNILSFFRKDSIIDYNVFVRVYKIDFSNK